MIKQTVLLFYFIISVFCSGMAYSFEWSLFDEQKIENLPRSLKIKINTLHDTRLLIGVEKDGYIKDDTHKIPLQPLTKYQLKINANADYELSLIKNNTNTKLLSVFKLPIILSSELNNSAIYAGSNWYRGQIKIIETPMGVIVLNIVDLEQGIYSILSPFVRINESVAAIKAAAIIIRSSLYALTINGKPEDIYHLVAENIGYIGLNGEKDFVIKLIKQTEGQILLNEKKELIYTPIRTTALNGSSPFELIGKEIKAWEKIITIPEIEALMREKGLDVGNILSLEQKVEGLQFVSIIGTKSPLQITQEEFQQIVKLPSPYFRIYSFVGNDKQSYIQIIGNLPNEYNSEPVLNIVRMLYEMNNSFINYREVLNKVYPKSTLKNIN